jgi:hypothetical protein
MSMPWSFKLEVNGKYVQTPSPDEYITQEPTMGGESNAAVFKLDDCFLSCGNWYLGRHIDEPESTKAEGQPLVWKLDKSSLQKWEHGESHGSTAISCGGTYLYQIS